MMRIVALISSSTRWTAASLAKELEVSDSTIYRDLDFLRDRLCFDIKYLPHTYRWTYDNHKPCPFCGK